MPDVFSFRDPAGNIADFGDRIVRTVRRSAADDLLAFLASVSSKSFCDSGLLVHTQAAGADATGDLLFEHERIPFVSYPYEWCPEMLHAAAELTLELAYGCIKEGFSLKDATPYNVLFRGPHPVFVDLLSFERRDPGDPTWLPYAQFVRTFLLPLLASLHLGFRLDQLMLAERDGIDPEVMYRWLSWPKRLRSPFLSLVTMPKWLASRSHKAEATLYQKQSLPDHRQAQFIFEHLLHRLRRQLQKARPVSTQSTWSSYMEEHSYSVPGFKEKQAVVSEALREFAPRAVLDIGCNTGHFSAMAARAGARTVAVDLDPAVIGRVWQMARSEGLDIQPLVVNLARPTPAVGWRNSECPSFLDRARGSFDTVMMLAVLHHLLVTERIPLDQVIDQAADLTRDLLILEFISPEDTMFRRIARGRDQLHRDLTIARFEEACRRRFDIVRSVQLDGATRWLYVLRKR